MNTPHGVGEHSPGWQYGPALSKCLLVRRAGLYALQVGLQMGPGAGCIATRQGGLDSKAHLKVGQTQVLARKPSVLCQVVLHEGQRGLYVGLNQLFLHASAQSPRQSRQSRF